MHGSVISHKEAHDSLKLNVDYLPMDDNKWLKVWECCLRVISSFTPDTAELFESSETSTTMSIQVIPQPPAK